MKNVNVIVVLYIAVVSALCGCNQASMYKSFVDTEPVAQALETEQLSVDEGPIAQALESEQTTVNENDHEQNSVQTCDLWKNVRCRVVFMLMNLYIKSGGDINAELMNGRTPLYKAVAYGDIKSTKLLLENGADVDETNRFGENLLVYAAANEGDQALEIVRLLFEHGANVNAKTDRTALKAAAANEGKCALDIVRLLLEYGAKVNLNEKYGGTALMYAAGNRGDQALEIVRLLLEHGANVNAKYADGCTVLIEAAKNRSELASEIVGLLIENGADVNAKDPDAHTPLMIVVGGSHALPQLVQALIKKGADVNVKDRSGRTALMYAACKQTEHAQKNVRLLLEHGAAVKGIKLVTGSKDEQAQDIVRQLNEKGCEEMQLSFSSKPHILSKIRRGNRQLLL